MQPWYWRCQAGCWKAPKAHPEGSANFEEARQHPCCCLQGPIYAESGGSNDDRRVSPDLERKVDAEVARIVREAYQRAVSILVWPFPLRFSD